MINHHIKAAPLSNDCRSTVVLRKLHTPDRYNMGDKLIITQAHVVYDDGMYQPPASIELRGDSIPALYEFLREYYGEGEKID